MVLAQFDDRLERAELVVFFDPEDADIAVAELDRLHAELEAGIVRRPDR